MLLRLNLRGNRRKGPKAVPAPERTADAVRTPACGFVPGHIYRPRGFGKRYPHYIRKVWNPDAKSDKILAMTSVGNILNTHTGPVRVVGMVPVAVRANGPDYNQALTQALEGEAASAVTADISSEGQAAAAAAAQLATTAASQPTVQAVFVSTPQAVTATPDGVQGGDNNQNGANAGGTDQTDGSIQANGHDKNGDGKSDTPDASGNDSGSTSGLGKDASTEKSDTGKSGKSAHWEPSGLAKIAALYRSTEKLSATQSAPTAAGSDNLDILG